MKNILCILFLFVLTLSCNEDKTSIKHLKGRAITTHLPNMKFPYRIGLCDSVVVMLDLASDSLFYHFASYPNFNHSYSVGSRGNGPNELNLSTPFQINEGKLHLWDGTRGKLYTINLSKPNQKLDSPTSFGEILAVDFVYINDTTLIVGDMTGANRLKRLTPKTREGLFLIPNDLSHNENELAYLWRSFIDFNPKLNKLVAATQFGELIEIFDMQTSSTLRILGKEGAPRKNNQIDGYQDIKWINDQIYALYSGVSRNQPKINGQRPPDGGTILRVFDAVGKPVMVYELDIPINGFTVDLKNNTLLGITSNSDQAIFLFDL